jgi:3-oxoadipate enol-lactonase
VFCPPGNAELLVEGVTGAELVLFDGARHAYFLQHREEASRRVLDFLAGHLLNR